MNLAIVLSAIRNGAKCCNHVAVEQLIKDEATGKLCAAKVKDMVIFIYFLIFLKLKNNLE